MAVQLFRVGGFASDNPADFISLYARVESNLVSTFRRSGTSVGYQVTAGKQFYICKIVTMNGDDGGNYLSVSIGYCDNDTGMDNSTARVNPVPLIGEPEGVSAAACGGIVWDGTPGTSNFDNGKGMNDIIWRGAPAGKYMYCKDYNAALASVMMIGFEV